MKEYIVRIPEKEVETISKIRRRDESGRNKRRRDIN